MTMTEVNNTAKYKAGFTNNSQMKDFVKSTPFKIVPGYTPEQLAYMGLKQGSHPTPVNATPRRK